MMRWLGIVWISAVLAATQVRGADGGPTTTPDLSGYKTVKTAQPVAPGDGGVAGQSGYLGLQLNANEGGRLVVTAVEPDSPAARVGVRGGDVLLKSDGKSVSTIDSFREDIQGRKPGQALPLTVSRQDKTVELTATLTALSRPMKLNGERAILGVRVVDASDERGARIDEVEPGSAAQRAGLRVGDLILKVGSTVINPSVRVPDALADKHPTQRVTLTVRRDGQEMELTATLMSDLPAPGGRRRGGGFGQGQGPGPDGPRAQGPWKKPVLRVGIVGIQFDDIKHSDTVSSKNWEESFFSSKTYTDKNATGQPVFGSVNDYFTEQSAGKLRVEGKWINWVTVSKKRVEYTPGSDNGRHPLLVEALNKLEPDDANALAGMDAVVFVYAGGRVQTNRGSVFYPHASTVTSRFKRMPSVVIPEGTQRMTNISVICHEMGRALGLPDLAARPENPGSEGLGIWCAMSNVVGSGRPQHFSAWCKEQLGWITPTVIDPMVKQRLVLGPIEDSPDECFKVLVRRDGSEYFLLENRQRKGFDMGLPGEGLLIWRVVDGVPALVASHGITGPAAPRVYLSMVPYPTPANSAFTPDTTPSSRSQLGGGLPVYITDIHRLNDGRIAFAVGYDVE